MIRETSPMFRINLHVVFTMNPASPDFHNRAATSPALFNRCVLDWFGEWSDDAVCSLFTPNSIPFSFSKSQETLQRTWISMIRHTELQISSLRLEPSPCLILSPPGMQSLAVLCLCIGQSEKLIRESPNVPEDKIISLQDTISILFITLVISTGVKDYLLFFSVINQ